jgi:hypothetical protein
MPREDKDDSGPAEDKPSGRGRRLRREDNVEGDKPDGDKPSPKSPSTRDVSSKSTPAQQQSEPEAAKPRRRRAEEKQEAPAASNEGGWMSGPAPKSAKTQAEAPIEDIQTRSKMLSLALLASYYLLFLITARIINTFKSPMPKEVRNKTISQLFRYLTFYVQRLL